MNTVEILLAEDNRGDVLLIRQALEEHAVPHRMHVVSDGAEAIAIIRSLGQPEGGPPPDLFVLDINLPKANGLEVLTIFRGHPVCSKIPVIVVSSSGAPREKAQMERLGISRYFQKPCDYEDFMRLGAVVRDVVEGHE